MKFVAWYASIPRVPLRDWFVRRSIRCAKPTIGAAMDPDARPPSVRHPGVRGTVGDGRAAADQLDQLFKASSAEPKSPAQDDPGRAAPPA